MMHCHVCDEDVPLAEIVNHVRLFHPDAYPIAERVEIHVTAQRPGALDAALAQIVRRAMAGRPPRRTG
jgi:hypothetical protein